MQQLYLGTLRRVLQYKCNVVRLDARHPHIGRERLSGDHHRDHLLKPEEREEPPCLIEIAHDDCRVIEPPQHRPLPYFSKGDRVALMLGRAEMRCHHACSAGRAVIIRSPSGVMRT